MGQESKGEKPVALVIPNFKNTVEICGANENHSKIMSGDWVL